MTDIASLVSDNLDIWTAAIERKSSAGRGSGRKLSLYGIERLRALILDLAVHGKLVPQDPADAPASELLPGMATERQRRIKAGEIKNAKGPDKPSGEPFELPSGWLWLPLWQTGNIFTGNSINAALRSELEANGEGWPFVATKDVGYGFEPIDYDNGLTVRFDDQRFNIASANSVFICAEGGSAGRKMAVSDREIAFGNKLIANEPWPQIEPRYILYTYLSDFFFECFSREMTGIIGGISRAKFLALPFPLPPYAEQQRIVTKVDELMALCDALEAQSASALEAHQSLVETLLATLVTSADASDLATNWARLETHFDTLFNTEASIDALMRTVLELAIRGRLTPQIAADEPADTLLGRVTREISAYSKEHRISPAKAEAIRSAELPFRVRNGWAWSRLCNVFRVVTDGDHQPPPRAEQGVAFLTIGNVTTGKLDFDECRQVPEDYYQSLAEYRTPRMGDILYTVVGATFGRPAVVETERDFCVQRHIAILKPADSMNLKYLAYLLASPFVYGQALDSTTGTAQPTIPLRPLRNFLVPVPPIEEQARIVAKVDDLMALCDGLKAQLSDAAATQKHLADAIVERAAA